MSLDAIVAGWKGHFYSADREIEWRAVESKRTVWLNDNTLIVGVVDAEGFNGEGKYFFGEWKTANPREKNSWKQVWKMNPQSLTYGVLMKLDPSVMPDCSTFTVRKAFKPYGVQATLHGTGSYDHAWFNYSPGELLHWQGELERIANEIRAYRAAGKDPWPTNFQRCFQYGTNYPCPFFEKGCNQQDWNYIPPNSTPKEEQDWVKEAIEAVPFKRDLVVLSPSRVNTWLGCRESYRKFVEIGTVMPATESLDFGKQFHERISEHYRNLMQFKGQIPAGAENFVLDLSR